jgi:F420-dependent oxidoreductase-like protein
MRVALMIEGQEDVGWDDWLALAAAAEEHGFEALFRSDHYASVDGVEERGALDAWATLAALAARTRTLRLGTLVSPTTFRHPSVLAKTVVTVDHVSGGRVELGMGAGWMEAEHRRYGFPFGDVGTRMAVLEEQVEIVCRSWAPEPFSFHGEHYALEGLDARPKPVQRPRPPLIVGGSGAPRTARLAARWADEYNTFHVGPEEAGRRRAAVAQAWERAGRDPAWLRFSLMNGFVVGEDAAAVAEHARRLGEWQGRPVDLDALRATWIVGTPDEVVERLRAYERAGVQRVMLQHHLFRDLDLLALIGREVIPRVAS